MKPSASVFGRPEDSNTKPFVMSTPLREIFDGSDDPGRLRSKYLSRLFGIFSERIVSIWAGDMRAPYENLGRPTVRGAQDVRGHTLDFTLRERATGKVYVSEMKCEIEYLNFRFFHLENVGQLCHHAKPAFEAFRKSALAPARMDVRVGGKSVPIDGAVLIWGSVCPEAKGRIQTEAGFHDILSLDCICSDLARWQNPDFLGMIGQYRAWSDRLFDGLVATDKRSA